MEDELIFDDSYLDEMEDHLSHIGVGHLDGGNSGRYPFGSGDNPYQHNYAFLSEYRRFKRAGYSQVDIARMMGFETTTELRNKISEATQYNRKADMDVVQNYISEHPNAGATEIGRATGFSESTIRSMLKQSNITNLNKTDKVMDILRQRVAEDKYIDIGAGTEFQFTSEDGMHLGISRDKLNKSVAQLIEKEGYEKHELYVEQMGTGKNTSLIVLCPPGTTKKEAFDHMLEIKQIDDNYDPDRQSFDGIDKPLYPKSVDSKRIGIRYAEDGGADKDGVIEIRRGVEDLSLGGVPYAQVRIAVDDKWYLKGMAVYSDDLEPGVDILVNSNKKRGSDYDTVFKKLKKDPTTGEIDKDFPFGANIDSQMFIDGVKDADHLTPINKCREAGDWDDWSDTLASQFLSKQPEVLAKRQLDISYDKRKQEYDEIMSLTNNAVKAKLLEDFAETCDGDTVHLKAAAMPRQSWKAILPVNSLKDDEIYAPTYNDGETVVLIRYPHEGRFEIPELKVNNKNPEAQKFMKNAPDAVGINTHTASKLSGADFDGDTVLVIPNNDHSIKVADILPGLDNFNTKIYKFSNERLISKAEEVLADEKNQKSKVANAMRTKMAAGYSPTEKELIEIGEDILTIKGKTKNIEMGKTTNLITDMTLRSAPWEDIEKVTKHAMVVIDSEKHHLDYKQSEKDNDIAKFKQLYQNGGGASTIISKASKEIKVPERKASWKLNEDGSVNYYETGAGYFKEKTKKDGTVEQKWIPKTSKTTMMEDAFATGKGAGYLSSGLMMEEIYVNYANKMKALANESRKSSMALTTVKRDPNAAKIYAKEVASLNAKLNEALKNSPYERQAQLIAHYIVNSKKAANPDMSKDELKKIKGRALNNARIQVGAKKKKLDISEKEWEAIQARAIGGSKLKQIFNQCDTDRLRKLAMPKEQYTISDSQRAMIKSMSNRNYTVAQIAQRLGISVSSVSSIINE